MEKNVTEKAISLFASHYGKKPVDFGYSVIDVIESQNVFVFGQSEEAVKAYKQERKIMHFISRYLFWPLLLWGGLIFYEGVLPNPDHLAVRIGLICLFIWCVVFLALWRKAVIAEQKCKDTVIWINFQTDKK